MVQTRAILAGGGRSLQFVEHEGLFALPGQVQQYAEIIRGAELGCYKARFTTLEKIKEFAKREKMSLFVDENFPVVTK